VKSGSIFKIRPTPMTMQSRGGVRNPAGHGGVYKVDGHGHQNGVSEEENSIFLPCHGCREPPPTPHFLSPCQEGIPMDMDSIDVFLGFDISPEVSLGYI
jgi:hypothetical protein